MTEKSKRNLAPYGSHLRISFDMTGDRTTISMMGGLPLSISIWIIYTLHSYSIVQSSKTQTPDRRIFAMYLVGC